MKASRVLALLLASVLYSCSGGHASTGSDSGSPDTGAGWSSGGSSSGSSSGATSSSSSSSSGSGSSSGIVTPYQACWNADDGGAASTQACGAVCCKAAYPAGWADFYDYSAECMCTLGDGGSDAGGDGGGGPCAAACATTFCETHDTASTACTTCLDTYSQPGMPCDFTSGFIASSCAADTQCNFYQGCFSGCP
jgi:hypothetical protein